MRYRKKPVVIEAYKYDKDLIGTPSKGFKPDWIAEAFESGVLHYHWPLSPMLPYELFVETLEGELKVSIGDYIIKGVKGEIYPCKPDIFEDTYEPAESGKHTVTTLLDDDVIGRLCEDIKKAIEKTDCIY